MSKVSKVLTAEQLMADRVPPPEDVPIPELGGVVQVRGLSRAQVLEIKQKDDGFSFEAHLISAALVAPVMTPEQVEVWRNSSLSPEMEEVTKKISAKSGLAKGADKEAYKSTGE